MSAERERGTKRVERRSYHCRHHWCPEGQGQHTNLRQARSSFLALSLLELSFCLSVLGDLSRE